MSTATEAITDAYIAEIESKARNEGFQTLLNGHAEFAGAVTGRVGFTATTDTEAIIYERATGEPRIIPAVYLRKVLGKRLPNGEKVFVAGDPQTGEPLEPVAEYQVGNYMCFLHPDHPGRDELELMGIGRDVICGSGETTPAGSIRTEFALRLHESKRHPQSYAIRNEYRERRREEDARAEQRQYTEAILELARSQGGAKKGA